MTDEKTDEELAIMARTQTFAFGVLMERYEAKLLRYIMRISMQPREGAEDILQDSFLKAYENINSFDSDQAFSSWMYRIVHNQTVSTWRKRRVRPEGHVTQVEDTFLAQITDDHDLLRDVDQQFLVKNIDKIFAHMSHKYREALILFFLEEKSYKEISVILQKPMGTVATLVNRAKKQFRKLYEEEYKQIA